MRTELALTLIGGITVPHARALVSVVSPASLRGPEYAGDSSRFVYFGPRGGPAPVRGKAAFALGTDLCPIIASRDKGDTGGLTWARDAIVVVNMDGARCSVQTVYLGLSKAGAAGGVILEFFGPPQGIFSHSTWIPPERRGMVMVAMRGLGNGPRGTTGVPKMWVEAMDAGEELELLISPRQENTNERLKNSWWCIAFYLVVPVLVCFATTVTALREIFEYQPSQLTSVGFVVCAVEAPSMLVVAGVCAAGGEIYTPIELYTTLSTLLEPCFSVVASDLYLGARWDLGAISALVAHAAPFRTGDLLGFCAVFTSLLMALMLREAIRTRKNKNSHVSRRTVRGSSSATVFFVCISMAV